MSFSKAGAPIAQPWWFTRGIAQRHSRIESAADNLIGPEKLKHGIDRGVDIAHRVPLRFGEGCMRKRGASTEDRVVGDDTGMRVPR